MENNNRATNKSPQEMKKVRFNGVALEYNGRNYVSVRPVPLLRSDNENGDDDEEMMLDFTPADLQIIEQHLSKVSDISKYTLDFKWAII